MKWNYMYLIGDREHWNMEFQLRNRLGNIWYKETLLMWYSWYKTQAYWEFINIVFPLSFPLLFLCLFFFCSPPLSPRIWSVLIPTMPPTFFAELLDFVPDPQTFCHPGTLLDTKICVLTLMLVNAVSSFFSWIY